jgi:hypothetical protein
MQIVSSTEPGLFAKHFEVVPKTERRQRAVAIHQRARRDVFTTRSSLERFGQVRSCAG